MYNVKAKDSEKKIYLFHICTIWSHFRLMTDGGSVNAMESLACSQQTMLTSSNSGKSVKDNQVIPVILLYYS
jgi:hypothetical protein